MPPPRHPPAPLFLACRRLHLQPTPHLLVVSVPLQRLRWYRLRPSPFSPSPTPFLPRSPSRWSLLRDFRASTSRLGIGQLRDSHRTPTGLHRIARKIGAGWPVGTVFRARQPIGAITQGLPLATIAHRILWLDGLDPGHNRGGEVDTFSRYIYIHGLADEPSLGRPASAGCVHLAATDLLPLFDRLPVGTLVWIADSP